jgi:hypothetical protein
MIGCHINGCWNNDFDSSYVPDPIRDGGVDLPDSNPCDLCLNEDAGPDVGNPQADITIDAFTGSPHGIAVIDGDVFVIEDQRLVMLAASDGGYHQMTIMPDIGPAVGLVADGDWLYWSSAPPLEAGARVIARLRVRPMIGLIETIATAELPVIEGMAIADGGVRWLDAKKGLVTTDGDGGESVLVDAAVAPTGAFSPVAYAQGRTHFAAVDALISMDDDGGVSSIPVSSPVAIAMDSTRGYVARRASTAFEVNLLVDGGLSPVLYSLGCRAMIVDPGGLYLADDNAHVVYKVRPNGTAWKWAWPIGSPHDLALDSSYLFYTVQDLTSEVHRVGR